MRHLATLLSGWSQADYLSRVPDQSLLDGSGSSSPEHQQVDLFDRWQHDVPPGALALNR